MMADTVNDGSAAVQNDEKPKTRRAVSQVRNPERTRAAILEAARREVSLKGLAGARVDVVARAPEPTSA